MVRKVEFSPELTAAIRDLPNNREFVTQGLKYEVGKQVLEVLWKDDVSQAELARRLGKSRQYVTKMLKGYSNFTLDSIAGLAIALKKEFHFAFTEPGAEAYLWRVIEGKATDPLKQEEAMYVANTQVTLVSMPAVSSRETPCSPGREVTGQEAFG